MKLFLSNFTNKLDKKGRVSVPAQYRTVLVNQEFSGIITYESFINNCIEASGIDRFVKLNEFIENLDPFSEERDAFAAAILGGSQQLSFDSEGRVLLPESYIFNLNLSENVTFVGKGDTFEIWNPNEFAVYAEKARALAKEKRSSLKIKGGF
ncbi:MAG: cell division/cell wall cluster transcriptional repressor MraZ [Alphaproteobacteria bacterium]|nr:cell division/cell wall cluster transcriptional repressor MraZ [Alphaproteobacteria bacterium]OJV15069.1 MAG: cell division/cell wall cluster transcriptional repressor MraZ [Alphaproteobacteria bacterium 33-17]